MKAKILIIALALVFVITVVPSMAKPKIYGDVDVPINVTVDAGEVETVICWDVPTGEEEVVNPATKWSVVFFQSVTYTYDESCEDTYCVDGEMVVEVDYGTMDEDVEFDDVALCLTVDQGMVEGELENFAISATPICECEATYELGTVWAKVKGLAPAKGKRQNNVFSEIVEVWAVEILPE
ncbi:MAG: hypothetical protein HF978_05950 [Desulfobacteraceae bacterium]|nr:hypothetical protein [Desulfobacteraceae bacterium]MBC2755077.1 hypothetical protein [Desulfobacteraceae bacterium]